MKSFSFSKNPQRKEAFFQSVHAFLSFIDTYYSSQIEQLSQINAKYEKLTNASLKNRKENQFFKKILKKEETKDAEKKPDIIEKLENEVLNSLIKAEEILNQTNEKPAAKPTLKKDPPPTNQNANPNVRPTSQQATKTTSSTLNKSSSLQKSSDKLASNTKVQQDASKGKPTVINRIPGRASTTVGGNHLKRIPVPTTDISTTVVVNSTKFTPTNPNRYNKSSTPTSSNSTNTSDISTKSTNISIQSNSKTNIVAPPEVIVEQPKVIEQKPVISTKSNPVVKEVKEEKKEEPVVENPPVNISNFRRENKIFDAQSNLKAFGEMKRSIKKKVQELNENISYYQERERKAKNRFISKLYSHANSAKTILARPPGEDEVKVFETIRSDDKQFSSLSTDTAKKLLVCQNILKWVKASLDFTNPELNTILSFRDLLEYETEAEFINQMVKLFRAWFMIEHINESIPFLKAELKTYLSIADTRQVMVASQQLWKNISYFTSNKSKAPVKKDKVACWFNFNLKNTPQIYEIECLKRATKIDVQTSVGSSQVDLISSKIEYINVQNVIAKLLYEYWSEKYENIEHEQSDFDDNRTLEFLKALRVLYLLTYGNLRKLPLFMMKLEC